MDIVAQPKRPKKQKGGKKDRKIGRNEIKCKRYRQEHRREKNKLRKLIKLFRLHPNNKMIANTINKLKNVI